MARQPTLAIPLDLPDVEVNATTVTKERTLLIEVESTLPTSTCQRCGQPISQFHGYDRPLTLRHLPILGMSVFIRIRPKRCRCPFCDDHPTTTQRLTWYDPNSQSITLDRGYLTDVAGQVSGQIITRVEAGTRLILDL